MIDWFYSYLYIFLYKYNEIKLVCDKKKLKRKLCDKKRINQI